MKDLLPPPGGPAAAVLLDVIAVVRGAVAHRQNLEDLATRAANLMKVIHLNQQALQAKNTYKVILDDFVNCLERIRQFALEYSGSGWLMRIWCSLTDAEQYDELVSELQSLVADASLSVGLDTNSQVAAARREIEDLTAFVKSQPNFKDESSALRALVSELGGPQEVVKDRAKMDRVRQHLGAGSQLTLTMLGQAIEILNANNEEGPHSNIRNSVLRVFWRKVIKFELRIPWHEFWMVFPERLVDVPVPAVQVSDLQTLLGSAAAHQMFKGQIEDYEDPTSLSVFELRCVPDKTDIVSCIKNILEEASESSSAPCQLPTLDTTYEQYGGRDPEAKEVAQWFQKPGSRVAAMVAAGGVGKTCLAVDVAWRLWRCKHVSAGALYVDCRGAFSRDALVMRLRAAAGLSGEHGGMEALLTSLAKLCAADRLGGSLLVLIDNAEDPAAADGGTTLSEVLAQLLMASAKIQVLVTARVDIAVQNMPQPYTYRIQPLTPGVAAALVEQLARGVLTGQEARVVAEACGCVPLAVRLVSEALVAGRLTLEDVQEATAGRSVTVVATDAGDTASMERKQEQDTTVLFVEMVLRSLPAAIKKVAMQVCAFTGVLTASSAAVVMGVGGSSEHEVRAQLASLHRLSVVLQHGDDSFMMHSHVRDVARKLLAEEAPPALRTAVRERFARYATSLLSRWQQLHEAKALKVMTAEVAAHWSDVEQFLADVAGAAAAAGGTQPLLSDCGALSLSPQLLQDTALLATLGNSDFLYAIGNAWMSPQYLMLTQKLVDVTAAAAAAAVTPDCDCQLSYAAALLIRCEALIYTGEYEESESLAAQAVELYEHLRGRDSVECAGALHLRASCLQGQGRGEEALPLYREALAVRQEALGATHRRTTATITHLAMQLSYEGQHAEAEGLYRQVLEAHQRNLGASHNLTAQAVSNLAGCLHELGKLVEAEALYRRALDVYNDTVGPRHRQVAFTLVGLAAVVREGGDLEAAEELYRRALDVCRAALGPRHPHAQMTLGVLKDLLRERGKGEEAEALEL
ncbi:hypothetical protein Vafri_10927 [Volvox africanus]|nr:hypothetical protein Vafri_10927 [Volvox africanus]